MSANLVSSIRKEHALMMFENVMQRILRKCELTEGYRTLHSKEVHYLYS